jgi:hypothetical protein
MEIFVGNPTRGSAGELSIRVDTTDMTLQPGVHFAALLRRGTYHFKLNDKRKWEITGYTKEYDIKDTEKREP